MKKTIFYSICIAGGLSLASCNDFLDLEPITDVATTEYLYAENDLAAYAANLYAFDLGYDNFNGKGNVCLPSHGTGYNLGLFDDDNGTDNQTANTPSKLFVTGQTYVGDYNLWNDYLTAIRAANYFLERVPQRNENGEISGTPANIDHYIGEVYFFRAWFYTQALENLGDFPILTTTLSEDYNEVREASRRRPRNEVARFILEDLDKAYELMLPTPPMSNRLTRDCAALLKSRVALFEGTWEKYHAGTAFVPNGPGWPGADMDYLSGYSYDANTEIQYFLQQAVEAADLVAQGHGLYGDYAAMFNSIDLSGMDEVLLWRAYGVSSNATVFHHVVDYLQRNGSGNTGYTRSMVDAFLMENGLPIYASGSGYQGDDTYEHLFSGRDPRMDMCILKTGDLLSDGPNLVDYIKEEDGFGYFYRAPIFEGQVENGNPTGYSLRKGLNTSGEMKTTSPSYTGCPVFRAAEAYLNYIEAYYELNGNLGGNCDAYWKALRQRAGMSTDYQLTISNTVMANERADWGSYSAGQQVDATLYNIRRERRIELISEGFRLADLRRWRALDQVKNVHIQGFNFWDSMYQLYTDPNPEGASAKLTEITLQPYGSSNEPNISAQDDPYAEGKYYLPYRKSESNIGFEGLNWTEAKYLYPISNYEFRLTTEQAGSNDFETSSIYQNPGWGMMDGTLPEGE